MQALAARIGIGFLLVAIMCGLAYWKGGQRERTAHAETKRQHAAVLRDLADRAAEVARRAEEASKLAARERAANDLRFTEQRDESNREIADLRRRLRSGELSLQPWWTCPASGSGAGDAADPAGGQDAGADLRTERALEIVSDADHADRWIGWLQSELVSTREAVKAAGCAVEARP